MFHTSLIVLPLLSTILTFTMGGPCPCALITSESLSNEPVVAIVDPTTNQFIYDDNLEEYVDSLPTSIESEPILDLSPTYPLFPPIKNLDTNVMRYKRPSWASIGKRATYLINKRPSWAQIG